MERQGRADFWSTFKKVDIYGEKATLNFRGNKSYRTKFGACISLLTFTVIFSYAILQLEKLINKRNPDIVSNTVLRDMDQAISLSASEERF